MNLNRILQGVNQWLLQTPERSLDEAYHAALKIKEIEDKHFQGRKVAAEFSNYGSSTNSYFIAEVKGYLQKIKVRLTEFKASRSIVNTFGPNQPTINNGVITVTTDVCLKKLQFIDSIIGKYQDNYWQEDIQDVPKSIQNRNFEQETAKNKTSRNRSFLAAGSIEDEEIIKSNKSQKATEKPGVLPRSFVNTFNRIKQEIDPQAEESEEAVLKKFRNSRYKTAISLKFILLLIIVPLLTQQLTKTFLITPLVNKYFQQQEQFIFINQDLEEEAFSELRRFEEALHFRGMIGLAPK
ncbi:MAG: proton extrusion protein PcxA, partial [Microcystis sp. M49629_WE12]|nr:proton extrusion protein PcxA [Microcystis sp. M49629_WE12]